ncbi:hypothetical protein PABG_07632 [Paracoccidioides brasiliensis Pb03]|nr:hypothetical protein PABG_07632 [Paracoccidioides brasiliensis Pb03]
MAATQTPEVLWAQRSSSTDPEKNILYIHLSVPDVPPFSAKLSLTPTSISFLGHSDTKKVDYKVDLELYGEIDVDNSKSHHSPRGVDLVLRKKELNAEYWPRFLKDAKKAHFLKTDFDKWVDEDEQDTVIEDDYSSFGGMGDDGLGAIDFSKLGAGGMGGMPGLGGMDGGADGENEVGEKSDDDMPELEEEEEEEEEEEAGNAESEPKIEEVA